MGYSHVEVVCANNTPIGLKRWAYGGSVYTGSSSEVGDATGTFIEPRDSMVHLGRFESNNPIVNGMDGLLRLWLRSASSHADVTLVIGWDVPNLGTDIRVGLRFYVESPGKTNTDMAMWQDVMEDTSNTASASTPLRKADVIPEASGFDGELKATAEIKHPNKDDTTNVIVYLKLDFVPS